MDVNGRVVPILDWGASVDPADRRTSRYREYWTEEEDLDFVYRQEVPKPDGSTSVVEHFGGVHGNFGYELVVRERTQAAVLRVDYFAVSPSLAGGTLSLRYEPKSVTVAGSLKSEVGLRVDIEMQPGFSAGRGSPEIKLLRVKCR